MVCLYQLKKLLFLDPFPREGHSNLEVSAAR